MHHMKPSFEKRVEEARKLARYSGNIKKDTLELVKTCANFMGIDGSPELVSRDKVPSYDEMPKDKDREMTSLIFIEFAKNGFVAVVGAGKDIDFTYKSKTGKILKALNMEWDEEIIILTIKGLEAVAVSKVNKENIFKSRNAVEHYIGEYLLSNGIPILNMYSHKNFTKAGWDKISGIQNLE